MEVQSPGSKSLDGQKNGLDRPFGKIEIERDSVMGKARSGAQVKKLLVLIERVCLVSGSENPAGNFAVEFSESSTV